MIERYQSKDFKKLWSDEEKFKTWFHVELAFLKSLLKQDQSLIDRLENAKQMMDWSAFTNEIYAEEEKTRHEMIAFLQVLEHKLGADARMLHMGLTSSDIIDTAFSLKLLEAGARIGCKLKEMIEILWSRALELKGVLVLGRTHGQAAEAMTIGIKLLSHMCEFMRSYTRLQSAMDDLKVGKFSGAVGVYGLLDPKVEEESLKLLGLRVETVATQIIPRDRHAAFFSTLAVLAGSIERLAIEIRLLAHGDIKEVAEPFKSAQKGSSAMPHKKNPILSENLCGLMRLVRSYALAALENQALWHERDMSHSSVERVIAPDATSLIDFAIGRLSMVIKELQIDRERIAKNLSNYAPILRSQEIMASMIEKGALRSEAYEIVQQASQNIGVNSNFLASLINFNATNYLSKDEISAILDNKISIKHEEKILDGLKRS